MNLKNNQIKSNEHGKRAGAIVKGMLQHSRSSSGLKEPIDINALADEYLRLSYHGLKAKDNSFNALMKTDYDPAIGLVNMIPQAFGRVLLTIYNNSSYAFSEKRKSAQAGYNPTIAVKTKRIGDKVFISVKDNGNGIPQKVIVKIISTIFHYKTNRTRNWIGFELEL